MDRRLAGVGILATALLLILVVSSVTRRTIPGRPTAAPVISAPQVGDCLLDPSRNEGDLHTWSTVLPSVDTAACTGNRFGEIIDVLPEFSAAGVVIDDAVFPATGRCYESARRLVGLPDETDRAVAPWSPAIRIEAALVGPGPRQRAVGQSWAACLMYLPPTSGTLRSTDGPLRDIWKDGTRARALAVCVDIIDNPFPDGCQVPHRFEIFGNLDVSPSAFVGQYLEQSCRELISQATAMPDITARGALAVQVIRFRYQDDGTLNIGGEQPGNGAAFCLITPSDDAHRLTASLRGLGDGPVPLD